MRVFYGDDQPPLIKKEKDFKFLNQNHDYEPTKQIVQYIFLT